LPWGNALAYLTGSSVTQKKGLQHWPLGGMRETSFEIKILICSFFEEKKSKNEKIKLIIENVGRACLQFQSCPCFNVVLASIKKKYFYLL
jgi:hypothetical protein